MTSASSSHHFVQLLEQLGYPEASSIRPQSLEWLFCMPSKSLQQFLVTLLEASLHPENVLSQDDVKLFDKMEQDGILSLENAGDDHNETVHLFDLSDDALTSHVQALEKHVSLVEKQVETKQRQYEQLTRTMSALEAEHSYLNTMNQVSSETKKKQENHIHGECVKLDVAIKEVANRAASIESTFSVSDDSNIGQHWLFQQAQQLEQCNNFDDELHEQIEIIFDLLSNPDIISFSPDNVGNPAIAQFEELNDLMETRFQIEKQIFKVLDCNSDDESAEKYAELVAFQQIRNPILISLYENYQEAQTNVLQQYSKIITLLRSQKSKLALLEKMKKLEQSKIREYYECLSSACSSLEQLGRNTQNRVDIMKSMLTARASSKKTISKHDWCLSSIQKTLAKCDPAFDLSETLAASVELLQENLKSFGNQYDQILLQYGEKMATLSHSVTETEQQIAKLDYRVRDEYGHLSIAPAVVSTTQDHLKEAVVSLQPLIQEVANAM